MLVSWNQSIRRQISAEKCANAKSGVSQRPPLAGKQAPPFPFNLHLSRSQRGKHYLVAQCWLPELYLTALQRFKKLLYQHLSHAVSCCTISNHAVSNKSIFRFKRNLDQMAKCGASYPYLILSSVCFVYDDRFESICILFHVNLQLYQHHLLNSRSWTTKYEIIQ